MIVAGTGHRPPKLLGYKSPAHEDLTDFARKALLGLEEEAGCAGYDVSEIQVISGGALGWDIALACATLQLKWHLTLAVPFAGQDAFWHPDSKKLYREVLEQANHVEIVCPGPHAGWKFIRRDEWMVDRCDEVLALFNGEPSGTGKTVEYAEKTGKHVINLWDFFVRYFGTRVLG